MRLKRPQYSAPDICHAMAALLNLSGHGLTDMTAYDQYFNGDLINCSLSDDDIKKNINALDSIG